MLGQIQPALPPPDLFQLLFRDLPRFEQEFARFLVCHARNEAAGWKIQDLREFNLGASRGVAIREFPLTSGAADYLLFVDREAVGVVEAKPQGTTLSGVAEQSEKYLTGIPEGLPHVKEPPPFSYESTGIETYFRDTRDPETRSRRVFAFHKPETLKEWSSQIDTLRARLKIDFFKASSE